MHISSEALGTFRRDVIDAEYPRGLIHCLYAIEWNKLDNTTLFDRFKNLQKTSRKVCLIVWLSDAILVLIIQLQASTFISFQGISFGEINGYGTVVVPISQKLAPTVACVPGIFSKKNYEKDPEFMARYGYPNAKAVLFKNVVPDLPLYLLKKIIKKIL